MAAPGRALGARGSRVSRGWRGAHPLRPLMAKLIVWGRDREEAVRTHGSRPGGVLGVGGVQTTIPFHRAVMRHPDFLAGRLSTGFVERAFAGGRGLPAPSPERARAAAVAAALRSRMLAAAASTVAAVLPLGHGESAGTPGVAAVSGLRGAAGRGRDHRPGRRRAVHRRDRGTVGTAASRSTSTGSASTWTPGFPRAGAGSVLLDGVSYLVDLGEGRGETQVVVDGQAFQVQVEDQARRRRPAPRSGGAGVGQRLVAPMPGKVVAVLVERWPVGQARRGARRPRGDEDGERVPGDTGGVVTEVHVTVGPDGRTPATYWSSSRDREGLEAPCVRTATWRSRARGGRDPGGAASEPAGFA